MLSVAILAGGLATRLRPLTETIPKSLVDVAGRPFIAWQLDLLREQGVKEVVLCVGYLGDQIERVVGGGSEFGVNVAYSHDGAKPLGTGGALRRALPMLGHTFFVLYGDSYLPVDLRAVERSFTTQGKAALMTVLKNDNRWDKSNAIFRDGCIIEYSKCDQRSEMLHIDYGLGALSKSVLAVRPVDEPFDLSDVYHDLARNGQLAGFEVHDRFYEIGSPEGLAETIQYLGKRKAK